MAYRRRWRKRYRRPEKMSEEEKVGWVVASIVFVVCFVVYFIHGFFAHCIFEWPIRWDIGTCWSEQIQPAKEKAAEEAVKFVP